MKLKAGDCCKILLMETTNTISKGLSKHSWKPMVTKFFMVPDISCRQLEQTINKKHWAQKYWKPTWKLNFLMIPNI